MGIKTFTIENDDGEEETMSLPTIMQVCHDCDGHGTTLCEGMRGHAYSAEEFAEEFDEEEREEYFRPGGMYDEQCRTCKGANVIPEVDEANLTPEQKTFYNQWAGASAGRARCRAEDRATMRAECGYRD